ncbi:kinase-like domain-containing protein [Xylariaceae sp. FL0804]|nr:kinase-like domain-containing protein [Xylariaceae sp. FL0804]
MEYCELRDLETYLNNTSKCPHKRLAEPHILEISSQVLGALSVMHEERFAHRDLKPANILIKSHPPDEWWVKIGDFGLTKRVGTSVNTNTVQWTPSFIPPEMFGFRGNPKSANPYMGDMWCLGETIFRALSGQATFDSVNDLWRYHSKDMEFPTSVLKTRNVSDDAIDFIRSIMLPEPKERLTADQAHQHPWMKAIQDQADLATSQIGETEEFLPLHYDNQPGMSDYSPSEPSGRWTTISKISVVSTARKSPEDTVNQLGMPGHSISEPSGRWTTMSKISGVSTIQKSPEDITEPARLEHDVNTSEDYQVPGSEPQLGGQLEFSAMYMACREGNTRMVERLIQQGASLADTGHEKPALYLAAKSGSTELIEYLIAKGVDPLTCRAGSGKTPLMAAAEMKRTGAAKLLVSLGVEVDERDSKNQTALLYAAASGNTHIATLLIANGADIMACDDDDITPLHEAASKGHLDICKYLIKKGAQ